MTFRLLTARDIDCRIQQITDKGLSLLLYKDARVDMDILDETVGALNWKRAHTRDNANCIVSIWDRDKEEWVSKEDTGTESNTEREKGLASDSFKRACFNWGIGRELYTAPFIWISADKCSKIEKRERNGKIFWVCNDRFVVTDIGYNDHREINRLEIINAKTGDIVYSFGKGAKLTQKPVSTPPEGKDTKTFICTACGKPIVEWNGRTPYDLIKYSEKEYHTKLCGDCLRAKVKGK